VCGENKSRYDLRFGEKIEGNLSQQGKTGGLAGREIGMEGSQPNKIDELVCDALEKLEKNTADTLSPLKPFDLRETKPLQTLFGKAVLRILGLDQACETGGEWIPNKDELEILFESFIELRKNAAEDQKYRPDVEIGEISAQKETELLRFDTSDVASFAKWVISTSPRDLCSIGRLIL
jgi:hypothetical protein